MWGEPMLNPWRVYRRWFSRGLTPEERIDANWAVVVVNLVLALLISVGRLVYGLVNR